MYPCGQLCAKALKGKPDPNKAIKIMASTRCVRRMKTSCQYCASRYYRLPGAYPDLNYLCFAATARRHTALQAGFHQNSTRHLRHQQFQFWSLADSPNAATHPAHAGSDRPASGRRCRSMQHPTHPGRSSPRSAGRTPAAGSGAGRCRLVASPSRRSIYALNAADVSTMIDAPRYGSASAPNSPSAIAQIVKSRTNKHRHPAHAVPSSIRAG